jgi:hypothetical protein
MINNRDTYHSYGCRYYEKMRRNQLRLNDRGLVGATFSFLQPTTKSTKEESLSVVRKFKAARTSEDISVIKDAFCEFSNAINYNGSKFGLNSITTFDIVFPLPSQFSANKLILKIYREINPNATFLDEPFIKKISQEIRYDPSEVSREGSSLSLPLVDAYFKSFRETYFDRLFEIKNVRATLRRYIYNFMAIQEWCKYYLPYLVNGKRILLIDDTIGEGVTLREAANLILPFNPKSITSFTVLRDYRKGI